MNYSTDPEMFLVALVQGKLFEEIAEGLKHAKVVIVCASNEVCIVLCIVHCVS